MSFARKPLLAFMFLMAAGLVFSKDILRIAPGTKAVTYGWADVSGVYYQDKSNYIVIDDASYPDPKAKRRAFTNAIASGSVADGTVNSKGAFIVLKGTVDLSDGKVSIDDHSYFDEYDSETHKRIHGDFQYDVGSNKTIIGMEEARLCFGGLRIKADKKNPAVNVIIRNIEFFDVHGSPEYDISFPGYEKSKASADAISIEATGGNGSRYAYIPSSIWIDSCSFSDGNCIDWMNTYNHDGLIDVKAGKNITVSYCSFTNHGKVMLLSPSDNYKECDERTITIHHNYFHDGIQRTPRARGACIHLYDNIFDYIGMSSKSGFAIGLGINTKAVIENNYFGHFGGNKSPLRFFDCSSSLNDDYISKVYERGNNINFTIENVTFDDSDKLKSFACHSSEGSPFAIPYSYSNELQNIPQAYEKLILQKNAGSGKRVMID